MGEEGGWGGVGDGFLISGPAAAWTKMSPKSVLTPPHPAARSSLLLRVCREDAVCR